MTMPIHRTVADWIEMARSRSKRVPSFVGSDCWLWLGDIGDTGYARIHYTGEGKKGSYRLSRVMLGLGRGNKMCALHKCDVRACVNPDHLYVGTVTQNVHDMLARGRHRYKFERFRGDKHPMAKLTEDDVRKVFLRLNCGESQASIARTLGVHAGAIQSIACGKNWAHLKLRPREALRLLEKP